MHKFPERFRKVTFQQHHIYFVIEGDDVVVVRVLHQARDAPRHIVF
jgi:plasmid stabilization system protein ParE